MHRHLFLLLCLSALSCKQDRQGTSPRLRTVSEAVYASGSLLPEQEYSVYSSADGFLVRSLVAENDTIRRGQLLFEVSNETRKVQEGILGEIRDELKARTSESAPAFLDLESRILTARTRIRNDSLTFGRYDRLLSENAISRSEWEKAQLQFESSRNELRSMEEQLRNLRSAASVEYTQALNQYEAMRSSNREGQIRSFLDGVVFEVYKQTGERVSPNEPIALVGQSDAWKARLSIDERDFDKIRTGQKLYVSFDAFPGKTYEARISRRYPKLNRAEQSFYADAVFTDSLPGRIYGLNLEANILLREKQEALTIPREFLLPGDSVLVYRKGKPVRTAVKTGIRDLEYVEILQGLTEADSLTLKEK